MRLRIWLPIAMFIAGLLVIGYSVATGEADVSLVVIFPVFSGSSGLFLLGIILVIASFFVGFVMLIGVAQEPQVESTVTTGKEQSRKKTASYGGLVLIGPIPIAFGSDKNIAIIMLIVGVILAAVFFAALFLLA